MSFELTIYCTKIRHRRRKKRQITAVSIDQIGDLYIQAQWSGQKF